MRKLTQYLPVLVIIVAGAIAGSMTSSRVEIIWIASLVSIAILNSLSSKSVIRFFALSFVFIFFSFFLRKFLGFVFIGTAEIIACVLLLFFQMDKSATHLQESLNTFLVGAASAFLAITLFYLSDGNYKGIEIVFSLILLIKLAEVPFQSALRSLVPQAHKNSNFVDLFFGFAVVGSLFLLFSPATLQKADAIALTFLGLTSLTLCVERTLALAWIYLTILDPGLSIFAGPLIILMTSPFLLLSLGPAYLAFMILIARGFPTSQEGLLLAGGICFLVGRGLVLRKSVPSSKKEELSALAAFSAVLGVIIFFEEATLSVRFQEVEIEKIGLTAALLISSVLFYFLGKKWPRLTKETNGFPIWRNLIKHLYYQNRIGTQKKEIWNQDATKDSNVFEKMLREESRQLFFWLVVVVLVIWSALWFDQ